MSARASSLHSPTSAARPHIGPTLFWRLGAFFFLSFTGGPSSNGDASQAESAVVVTKLDFAYDGMDKPVLKKFDLDLPAGSR